MKRSALLAAIAALGFASAASAADMPVKAPAIAPAPILYNWSGYYIGGNIGYGWGGSTGDLSVVDPFGFFTGYAALGGLQYPSVRPKGVVGGGQIGYNFQTGAIVWGAVADFQFSDMKESKTVFVPALPTPGGGTFFAENQSHSAKIEWFGTVRGRLGYAFNNVLPYITGGLAYGQVENDLNLFIPISGAIVSGSHQTTRAGWTVGGGLEYGLTRSWTIGAEYLYVDLGHASVTAVPIVGFVPGVSPLFTMNDHFTAQIARALLNYRF